MRYAQLILWGLFLFACLILAAIHQWIDLLAVDQVEQLQQVGLLAIGWGAGVMMWFVSGHFGTSCLFAKAPRAWRLYRRNILSSIVPVLKYLTIGVVLLGVGATLVYQLSGLYTTSFDIGFITGIGIGLVFSIYKSRKFGNTIDFLEANSKYLNSSKISLFSDDWT